MQPVSAEIESAFRSSLGPEGVVLDSEALKVASTALFRTDTPIPIILRPGNRGEVQECIRIAKTFKVALYPVSTGKNWGYGSRVPTAPGTALLDLGRLNRILDFSEELAYVTVEPGVTQRQLFDFLTAQGSQLCMDCTGATAEASVVANALERGFGHTPYADHFAHVCALEVVLGSGEVIETGHARFGAATAPTYRWGVGAVLDGLFSQSNFGVVTRCTLWLMPRPERFQAFFFQAAGQDSIGPIIDALRPLRLDGTLRSAAHIGNGYKVLSGLAQFPWDRTGGVTPLSPELLATIARERKFGDWNGSGGLYGTRQQVAEQRRRLRQALSSKVSRIAFVDERMLDWAERASALWKFLGWDLRPTIELARPLLRLLQGVPTDTMLKSVYWRKPSPPPDSLDPVLDGCGLLWCAPVAPLTGGHARRLCEIATRVLLSHRFEPLISVTLLTERTLACIVAISFDREVEGEDERARACHDALVAEIREGGYHFYRLGVQSMAQSRGGPEYARVMRSIKEALDPEGILAPGRYPPD